MQDGQAAHARFGSLLIAASAVFRTMRPSGITVAILSAFATVCYVVALRLTTVAEVMAIAATGPFLSGGLAWLLIGEKEHWATIVASVFALAGVVVMVGPGAFGGHVGGSGHADDPEDSGERVLSGPASATRSPCSSRSA